MLVRGVAGSIIFFFAGSAALAADAAPGDASAPSEQSQGVTQAPAAPVVSASGASTGSPQFLILPALPADYFATTPHLLGEWPGIRSKLSDLGINVSITGVDEGVMNFSGGERRIAQEAGQVALQAEFDLQKSLGLQGTRFEVTLVNRWGRDAATDAGIPALQLLNEVYGRGNILRLE
jgi:porin